MVMQVYLVYCDICRPEIQTCILYILSVRLEINTAVSVLHKKNSLVSVIYASVMHALK